eukprot:PhF_6_TR26504/c0_g1_i1/m.38342
MPRHDAELAESERHNEEAQRQALLRTFYQIDANHDGRITRAEFEKYLKVNPTGWPLGDILSSQTPEQSKQIMEFWFRKLDVANNGAITQEEFLAFFHAMTNMDFREGVLTDFLLDLFDENMDGRLDRSEYTKMLTVLLGKEPSPALVKQIMDRADKNHDGKLSREELRELLHRVHCDVTKLGGAEAGIGDLVALAVGVAAIVVGGYYLVRFLKR